MHPWVRSGGWRKITGGECIIQPSQYSGSDRHRAEYQWECESGNERKWKWPIITCPFVCLPAAMFTIGKNLWQTQIRRWPRPPSIRGLLFSRDGKWYLRMLSCCMGRVLHNCSAAGTRLPECTNYSYIYIQWVCTQTRVPPPPGTRPHPRNQQFKGSRWPELVCFKCFVFPTSLPTLPTPSHLSSALCRQQ